MTVNTKTTELSQESVFYLHNFLAGQQQRKPPHELLQDPWKKIITTAGSIADIKKKAKKFEELVKQQQQLDYEKIMRQIWSQDPQKPIIKARKTVWTSDELLQAEFQDQKWTIKNIVLEGGVTEISSKPKMGKTWLTMQGGVSVSSGFPMFGSEEFCVKQGKVIIYALEDSARRIKSRLHLQQIKQGLPLIFKQTITPLDKGGLEELAKTIEEEKPVLIIIDTFTPAHSKDIDENKAEDVCKIFLPLRILADETNVSFIINHHHKKGAQGDPRDDSRGSSAIGAAVDIVAGLYKENGAKILRLKGNDIDDLEYVISFNDEIAYGWHIIGDAQDIAKSKAEKELLDKLEEMGKATVKQLASELGKSRQTVNNVLVRLHPDKVNRITEATGKGSCKYIYTPIIK